MAKTTKHTKRATARQAPSSDPFVTLKEMGWKDVVPQKGGGGIFPPGRGYEGIIQNATVETDPNSKGHVQVHYVIVGTSDELLKQDGTGMIDHKWSNMRNANNLAWVRGELQTLDLDWPEEPHELPELLGELVNASIRFDVVESRGKDEFRDRINHNIYFRERLDEPAGAGDGYTADEINALSDDDLEQLARDNDVDPDMFDWDELRAHMIKLLV